MVSVTQRSTIVVMVCMALTLVTRSASAQWRPVPLTHAIDSVAPWTGIVLWTDHDKVETDAIQLEYCYLAYDQIVVGRRRYDWALVETLLNKVACRGHQAILRFYFVYPGRPTTVPKFIKRQSGYKTIQGESEGRNTEFVDWSHPEVERFTLDFYSAFARQYDADPRLAYLQTGFGLWGEYHVYDGPRTGADAVGKIFPSKAFQARFLKHLDAVLVHTPWMISIDAADADYSPFAQQPTLLRLSFGLFDDSFLCRSHAKENALNWRFFGPRWQRSPAGGEFSYYTRRDQRKALSSSGPNGRSFRDLASEFHITFMIGNDQPAYQSMKRIAESGQMMGYRLKIVRFESSREATRVTVTNTGVAPPYHDAYVAVNGVRAGDSLLGLLPGESRTYHVARGGTGLELTIQSDRLVDGQTIPFEADLE